MNYSSQLSKDDMTSQSAVIMIPTFNRNEWLNELLVELSMQIANHPQIGIVVIDNSPNGAAKDTCSGFGAVRYVHEPVPGIVAARNRGIAEIRNCSDKPRYVIFIDDDELPSPEWLDELLGAPIKYDAAAAIGPVVPVLPEETPLTLRRGGFFDRIHLESGSTPPWGTTNNTIILLESLLSLEGHEGHIFDPSFSMSGGSDADLFWRLKVSGQRLVWVEEAVVYERFNTSRANWKWISKRNVRLGNVSARLKLRTSRRSSVLLLGLGRIVFGLMAGTYNVIRFRTVNASSHSHVFKGIGMVSEVMGRRVNEYARVHPGSVTQGE